MARSPARAGHTIGYFLFTEGKRTLLGGKFSTHSKEIQVVVRQKGQIFITEFSGTAWQGQPRCHGAQLTGVPGCCQSSERLGGEQAEYPDGCREPQDGDCGPHGPRRTRGKTGPHGRMSAVHGPPQCPGDRRGLNCPHR